jgi:hypothetical protein
MICDFNEVAWSGVEVLADPSTTLALAEVTAYLCHALEMQDATRTLGNTTTATTRTSATMNSKTSTTHSFIDLPLSPYRKRRRQNRHALQERIYTRPALLSDPDATVEQIILSSLGLGSGPGDDTEEDEDDVTFDEKSRTTLSRGGGSVLDMDLPPPKVVVTNSRGPAHDEEEEEEEKDDIDEEVRRTTPRVNHHKTGTVAPPIAMDWNDRARDEVNVELLRERIGERAAALTSQRQRPQPQKVSLSSYNNNSNNIPTTLAPLGLQNDGKATTVEDSSNPKNINTNLLIHPSIEKPNPDLEDLVIPGDSLSLPQGTSSVNRIKNISNLDNNDSAEYDPSSQSRRDRVQRRNGETPVDHFYRILDEVMEERRDKGVNLVLSRLANSLGQPKNNGNNDNIPVHHAANDDITKNGNPVDSDTIPQKADEHVFGRAWNLRANSAATTDEGRRGFSTIRRRVSSIQNLNYSTAIGKQPPNTTTATTTSTRAWLQKNQKPGSQTSTASPFRHRAFVLAGLGVVSLVVLVWVLFALYGMYKFFFPSGIPLVQQSWDRVFSTTGILQYTARAAITSALDKPTSTAGGAAAATATSEVVIRIIREVVHVTDDGTILKSASSMDPVMPSEEQLEQVSQCVSAAF